MTVAANHAQRQVSARDDDARRITLRRLAEASWLATFAVTVGGDHLSCESQTATMAFLTARELVVGMKTRLFGLGLIAFGVLFAVLFVYLPIRDAADGLMGPASIKALVFIPLTVVTGFALLIAGSPVLEAFQARPKSSGQLTLVLLIIIGSGVLTGLAYWQTKTRWLGPPDPVILDASPKVPDLSNVR